MCNIHAFGRKYLVSSVKRFLFLFSDKDALTAIEEAIHEFHKRTCVKFVPRTDEVDYIEFEGNLG